MTGRPLHRAIALALAAWPGACGQLVPSLPPPGSVSPVILDAPAAAAALSAYRSQHGLGPVVLDPDLVTAASLQAAANARAGRLSHDAAAGSFNARMAEAGLARAVVAENLSAGSERFDQVLARWKASPEHNRNMLIPGLTRVGIARVDAPETRFKRYWALVMAGR